MKTRLIFTLLAVCAFTVATAQDNTGVYDYFNSKIDEAVSAAAAVEDCEAENVNHVYARLFSSPVLYNSVIKGACAGKDAAMESDVKAMDDERESVIEEMLVNLYRTAPSRVHMTEAELRSEKSVPTQEVAVSAPMLDFKKLDIPTDVAGGMKTTVTKPNYWKFSGRTSLTFTQSFISDNWYQGGEKNYYAMLATLDLDMNYNDKDRITWTNHFDIDLGFATSQADTLHTLRTNTDKLRIESTFGYKIVRNLDLAAKLKIESQMLPNYPVNTPDFISNCLAPLDANASLGFNFKPNFGNFRLEVFLAPLSAYNFRYVHYERLANSLGVYDDNGFDLWRGRARQDYGTQLVVTVPTYKLTSFLDVWSRLEYYTNYQRVFFQWETKFNVALSKYFTASLMLNARFDDSIEPHDRWKYLQLKELFTLGVAYAW